MLCIFCISINLVCVATKAMVPPLAPPKDFKKFFSRRDPNGASTSATTPPHVVIPILVDGNVQPTTPSGKPSLNEKFYENS